ncbi:hypothetical protein [Colwellia sp. E150_009]
MAKLISRTVILLSFTCIFVFTSFANTKIKQKDLPKQLIDSINELSLGNRFQPQWKDVPIGAFGDRVPPEWLDEPDTPIDALGQNSIFDVIQVEINRDLDLFRDYLEYTKRFNCDETEESDLIVKRKAPDNSIELKLSTLGSINVKVESFISAKKILSTQYKIFNTEQYNVFINKTLKKYGKMILLSESFQPDETLDAYLKEYSPPPFSKGKGLPFLPNLKQEEGTLLHKIEQSAQSEYISKYNCNKRYLNKEEKIKYRITHELQTNNIQKLLNQKLDKTIATPPAKQCVGENTIAQYRDIELVIINELIKNKPYPVIEQYFAANMPTDTLNAKARVNYYKCKKNNRNQCKGCLVGSCCYKEKRYYGERKLVKSKAVNLSLQMLNVEGILTASINFGDKKQTIKLQETNNKQILQQYVHPSFVVKESKITMPNNIQSTQVFEMTDNVTTAIAPLIEYAIEAF